MINQTSHTEILRKIPMPTLGLFFDGFLLRLIFGVPLNYFVCRVSDGRASGVNIRNAYEYMTARECGVMWGYSLVLMLKQHSRLPPRVP